MNEEVIVRFPPSPTGYLHIGGARTAIYNWLFARKMGGKMILRIEDTDAGRSTEESIHGIIEGLKWLGVDWDEGPYFQSHFKDDHLAAAQKLLTSGHAYKCFCTKDEAEEKRGDSKKAKAVRDACASMDPAEVEQKEKSGIPYAIRFKVPRDGGSVLFQDTVYGVIEKKHDDIEDFAIVRSNGQPLYVLANAVDDIRDKITHIIRGQDGLANTPKQILLYKALGVPIPKFAHMSLTLDPQKAKISKRKHGEVVAVHFYKEQGFLPWALVNFLVLLGWSNPESKEIFSKEELIQAFSLEGIGRANAVLNIRQNDPKFVTDPKAVSINAHYLRSLPVEEIIPYVKDELKKAQLWEPSYEKEKREWFLKTVDLIRARYHLLTDFATLGRPYFSDDYPMEEKALQKNILKNLGLKDWLPTIIGRLEKIEPFDAGEIEKTIIELISELQANTGAVVNGIRALITGQAVGPSIPEVLAILGRQKVSERLKAGARYFSQEPFCF